MHTASAPWLSLGRGLMCSPGATEIKIGNNICTSILVMHKTQAHITTMHISLLLHTCYTHITIH